MNAATMLAFPGFLSPWNQNPRTQTLRQSSTCAIVGPVASSEKREQTRAKTSTPVEFRLVPLAQARLFAP